MLSYKDGNMADREIVIRIPEDKYDRLIKQVMWERDIAISQLDELGYGLG